MIAFSLLQHMNKRVDFTGGDSWQFREFPIGTATWAGNFQRRQDWRCRELKLTLFSKGNPLVVTILPFLTVIVVVIAIFGSQEGGSSKFLFCEAINLRDRST